MKAKVINDICLQVTEGELLGSYVLYPNSVRRDIELDFIVPTGARLRKDRPFDGKDLNDARAADTPVSS